MQMIISVLSNQQQYEVLFSKAPYLKDIRILCDNPSFYDFLTDRNTAFEPLHEEYLKNYWSKINTWSCEKALCWDYLINTHSFDGIELNSALYVYFSYYLVSFLKSYLFAEYIYNKYTPKKLIIFEDVYCPDFPEFNGNYFLNIFLKKIGKYHGLEIVSLKSRKTNIHTTTTVKEKVKNLVKNIYSIFSAVTQKQDVFLVRGSLRHLTPVIKLLKNQNQKIFLYGFEFNFEQFIFCLKENIRYILPECFMVKSLKRKNAEHNYKKDFDKLIDLMRLKEWFRYEDADLSRFVCNELSNRTEKYLENISLWSQIYFNIINAYNIKGLIVDEDIAPRSAFMNAFFKSRGIETFCISHGYGPIKFSLNKPDRRFYLSETFVHSEYEKFLYSSWGWDDRHIHVTGMPRYDRLLNFAKMNKEKKSASKKIKLLLCGSTMFEYAPNQVSYIGIRQYDVGHNMKILFKDVIKAIDAYNIELIVKPHNVGEEDLWLRFIEKYKKKNNIILASAKADFFDLLSECDAMVLGYWSTAVIEAVIVGIPVVVVNYSGLEDGHPFAKENLCMVSRNYQQLKDMINEIYSVLSLKKDSKYKNEYNRNHSFYLGKNDGKNTQRIVDAILNSSNTN